MDSQEPHRKSESSPIRSGHAVRLGVDTTSLKPSSRRQAHACNSRRFGRGSQKEESFGRGRSLRAKIWRRTQCRREPYSPLYDGHSARTLSGYRESDSEMPRNWRKNTLHPTPA
eukprot:1355433-Rhodomonas_salina.1